MNSLIIEKNIIKPIIYRVKQTASYLQRACCPEVHFHFVPVIVTCFRESNFRILLFLNSRNQFYRDTSKKTEIENRSNKSIALKFSPLGL